MFYPIVDNYMRKVTAIIKRGFRDNRFIRNFYSL